MTILDHDRKGMSAAYFHKGRDEGLQEALSAFSDLAPSVSDCLLYTSDAADE